MPAQNTKPADYPQAVLQQIALLAQNIVIARKRRKETQAQWAQRLGVSQPTMARIERGDPSVAMASYVMCMWLINPAHGLAELIAPQNDMASLEREVARIRTRPRRVVKAVAKKGRAATEAPALGGERSAALPPAADASAVDRREASRASKPANRLEIEKLLQIAGLDQRLKLEKAMQAMDQRLEIEKAMRSIGLDVPGNTPNSTAAGLAALIAGHKKGLL